MHDRRRRAADPPALEPLEPRLLLSSGPDLLPTILDSRIPDDLVSGGTTTITVPVRMFNAGNIALAPGQRIDVEVFARPVDATDDSLDVLLAALTRQWVSRLGPGRYRTFDVRVQLPLGMEGGEYLLGARVDTSHQVVETNEDNNTAVRYGAIDVQRGYVDLTGTFDRVGLPPAVVAGRRLTGTVKVAVRNEGNAPLPVGQRVDVQLVARSTLSGVETLLATRTNLSISGLKAGQTKVLAVPVSLRGGLGVGEYELVARILPAGGLGEDDADNNVVTLGAGGQTVTITSALPFYDLLAETAERSLPGEVTSGDGQSIVLPVRVTNLGNVPLPSGQRIEVKVYAHPAAAGDDTGDILVATLERQWVSRLGPGQSRTFRAVIDLPLGMPTELYVFVAKADAADAVVESDETNNVAAAGSAIHVTRGFVDVTGMIGTMTLPSATVAGQPLEGTIRVIVRNEGNAPLPSGQRVSLQVVAISQADGSETLLATRDNLSVSRLGAGRTRTLSVRVGLHEGLSFGTHEVLVRIIPAGALGEENDANNEAVVNRFGNTPLIHAAEAFVDLTARIGSERLPASTISGDGTALRLPVRVTNGGNVALAPGQRIDVHVYARPFDATDDSRDVLVTTAEGLSVSRLGPGRTRTLGVTARLPLGMTPDSYYLVAVVDASNKVVESDETNNSAVTGSMVGVVRGFIDLQPFFRRVTLPTLAQADRRLTGRVYLTVRNAGNAPLPYRQRVNVQIVARSLADDSETVLGESFGCLLGAVKPGRTGRVSVRVSYAAGLPAGSYELLALVVPADALTDEIDTNNTALTTLSGQPILIQVS